LGKKGCFGRKQEYLLLRFAAILGSEVQ